MLLKRFIAVVTGTILATLLFAGEINTAVAQDTDEEKDGISRLDPNPTPIPQDRGGKITERAAPNVGLKHGPAAPPQLVRALQNELEGAVFYVLDEFQEEIRGSTLTSAKQDDLLSELRADENADPEVLDELEKALSNLDYETVQRVVRRVPWTPERREDVVQLVRLTSLFNDFKRKVEFDEESAQYLRRDARRLETTLNRTSGISRGDKRRLTDSLDDVVAAVTIRENLDLDDGGFGRERTVELPAFQVPVVYYHRLPRGRVYVINGGLIAGATEDRITFGTGTAAQVLGLKTISGPSYPDTVDETFYSGDVVVRNPPENNAVLHYEWKQGDDEDSDYQKASISPGREVNSHQITGAGRKNYLIVRYLPTPDSKKPQRYILRAGSYQFTPRSDGWKMVLDSYRLNLDNRDNTTDFKVLINNQRQLVNAGRVESFTSSYPFFVSFDNGNGHVIRKKIDKKEIDLEIALSTESNTWDLFDRSAGAREFDIFGF